MAKAAATRGHLCLLLFLFFPLGSFLPVDAASLCYNFTIDKAESGLWRQEVQGQLNEETFLTYNTNNNCHVFGLENRLNATDICVTQAGILKDGADLLKAEAIRINLEENTITGPLTLWTRMCCHEEGGHFKESRETGLNGHTMLDFDSSTGKWTEVDPGSSWMREKLEENRDLTTYLQMISRGDCRSWLKKLKPLWEEKLVPTASPTAASNVNHPSLSPAIKPNISVLLIILPFLLPLWI